ncbi:EGF-like calcium-binding [Cynara cardunculus var. scolymus]|uniref:EGF-like calcium-binding n=1 Tax=Cynara cardunculus var. scolymus TaxID=59895 RepID=A0A103XK74_CYNCS|nr:EGF-like calcium-binding [Cynara cardunculus var. scolymus]
MLTFPLYLDINECHYPEKFPCYGTCVNTVGNYTWKCKEGYSGDAKIRDGCRRKPFHPLVLYIASGKYPTYETYRLVNATDLAKSGCDGRYTDECKNVEKFPCYETCANTPGNYTCKCKRGYSGDAKIHDGCRHKPFPLLLLSSGNPYVS